MIQNTSSIAPDTVPMCLLCLLSSYVVKKKDAMKMTRDYIATLTYKTIGCAIEVHKQLGPGLIESVYEKCFTRELAL